MMDRLLTFAEKTRQRGPGYVRDLLTHHARATRYRLGSLSRRVTPGSLLGTAPRPMFHFATDDVCSIVSAVPESIRRTILLEAEQYLQQRFFFRGLPEVHFQEAVDWNFAPEGNTSWSWDLNRHRSFLTLGTAHHYAGGPPDAGESPGGSPFKDKLIQLWSDWMQRNPAGQGQNWRSPFEVAARLRNWTWAYFLLLASSEVSPLFLHKAWRGLRDHAEYLAEHMEYHWPNNHLLLEAVSLYEFAVIFKEHGGERYLALASRVLEAQVKLQILGDGVHSELCPMYHDIVATELNAFTLLCRRLGKSLPLAMEERIFSMRRFSTALRRNDGSIPLLGDSSFPDTCLRFDASSPIVSDLTYWLRPEKLSARGLSRTAERPVSLELFTEAGYGMLRSDKQQTHLTFDFGPFSRCAAANHGHSDALSFELHAAGRPWIVDSGFFYSWNIAQEGAARRCDKMQVGNPDRHQYFRSAAAHNTLVIDGREQNELSVRREVGGQARVRLNNYRSNSNEAAIGAEVEPFWSTGDAIHSREISLNQAGEVTMRDRVMGCSTHQLQWLLHFAVDLEVELQDATTIVAWHNDDVLVCELCSSGPAPLLRLVRGEDVAFQGWVATSSARIAPSWVLVAEMEGQMPIELNFKIRISTRSKLKESSDLRQEPDLPMPELAGAQV